MMPIFYHSDDFCYEKDGIPPDNGDTTQPLTKIYTAVHRPCIGQKAPITIKRLGHETN